MVQTMTSACYNIAGESHGRGGRGNFAKQGLQKWKMFALLVPGKVVDQGGQGRSMGRPGRGSLGHSRSQRAGARHAGE